MTNKERLEIVKRIYHAMSKHVDENGDIDYPKYDEEALRFADEKHIEWLIEQAEHAERLSKKAVELNVFLQGYMKPKDLGRNVVDVAMDMIREQAERVQELEAECGNLTWDNAKKSVDIKAFEIENKRLREAFEDLKRRAMNVVPEREEDGSIIEDEENRFIYEFCKQALEGDTHD